MKIKEFTQLAKRLLPELPGFEVKRDLMFISPIGHTLRGLCFEGSSFDARAFYVSAFFLPLFVPHKFLALTLGTRVRNRGIDGWDADAPNLLPDLMAAIKKDVVPWLSSIQTPRDVARAARAEEGATKNPHVQAAAAYALAYAGDVADALDALDQLARFLSSSVPWEREIALRAQLLKEKLLEGPEVARGQLELWRTETLRNLGLSDTP